MSTHDQDLDRLARDLFSEAADINDRTKREKYVADACAGNQSLLERVLSFLAAHDSIDDDEPEDFVGRTIGKYSVKAEIGSGGMGKVYRATRTEDYHKDVAIKVIHARMWETEVKRRFAKEMQIMAKLSHPNLAQLYTAGKTENDRPYVVMEYIPGDRIDRYCDNHRLTIRQRLALFVKVCAVVSYTHDNGVIHCDIKSSNIMVTSQGEPKLIDFGIAKMLRSRLDTSSHDPTTMVHLQAFTPEYASPEQVRGEKSISRLTDVYSLGVVLYELLTGHRAHRFKGDTYSNEDLREIVCHTEVTRPSHVIDEDKEAIDGKSRVSAESVGQARSCRPRDLRRILKGDLDSILMKALAKEKADRYRSVAELADDIQRYLNGRPVSARSGAWRKLIKALPSTVANNLPPTRTTLRPKLIIYAALLLIVLGFWKIPALMMKPDPPPAPPPVRGSIFENLSHSDQALLKDGINQLLSNIGMGISKGIRSFEKPEYINDCWELSQAIISGQGQTGFNEALAIQSLHRELLKGPYCEYGDEQKNQRVPHIAASAWGLLASMRFSSSKTITDDDIDKQVGYLLAQKNAAGWWPLFPSSKNSAQVPSTYATAYSLLALNAYRKRKTKSPEVAEAISSGRAWLLNSNVEGTVNWNDVPEKDAPSGVTAKASVGLSGLVFHVLHVLQRTEVELRLPDEQSGVGASQQVALTRLSKGWLDQLPVIPPDPAAGVTSEINFAGETWLKDKTTNLNMPWAIIALADAYAAGDDRQKALVLEWMSKTIHDIDVALKDPKETFKSDFYYKRAELLIALRYLAEKDKEII
jgi:serine/threonine protein kinase